MQFTSKEETSDIDRKGGEVIAPTSLIMFALGIPDYGRMAYNLALSIKHHSPDVNIKLIYEPSALSHLSAEQKSYFDVMQLIELDDCYDNGKFNPGKAKLSIYKYLDSQHTIYLDVDAVCLRPLEPLMDECIKTGQYFLTQYVSHVTGCQEEFKDMAWMECKYIWDKYGFDDNTQLPATNTSFMYIRKCEESELFFKKALENINDPFPVNQLKLKWGGTQPDELYLNITMAQFGLLNGLKARHPVYFSNYPDNKLVSTLENEGYYLIGYFGGKGWTHPSVVDYCEKLINVISIEKLRTHIEFKIHKMMKNKHVNRKRI